MSKYRGHYLITLAFLFVAILQGSTLQAQTAQGSIAAWRDSLDAITLPVPQYRQYAAETIIRVKNQAQWNDLEKALRKLLKQGRKNIAVEVEAKSLTLGITKDSLYNLQYPNANIRIKGNGVKLLPEGVTFSKNDKRRLKGKAHYSFPVESFSLDDVIQAKNKAPLSLYDDYFYIESVIEPVKEEGTEDILNTDKSLYKTIYKTWRFKTDLPDLSKEECSDFYILLTRDWTSYRHKVNKVENGYLYFQLKSDDATTLVKMCLDPNSDKIDYKTSPRCRLVNYPLRKGLHIEKGMIYIPNNIKQLTIGKGARLLKMEKCNFNSFEVSGFKVIGAGDETCIEIHNCIFGDQLWVRDNSFQNISGRAIQVSMCRNASVYNNKVDGTRMNALFCTGWNVSVWKNELRNIGYMSQTMALTISGNDIHVFENIIEDFNYSGISTGSDPSCIIERNIIRFTPGFLKNHQNITLADGGGIYVSPWVKNCIIRYNVIDNLSGTGANRGIFLDDGGKNLVIYGNLVMNTHNCYDIDLRLCRTYAKQLPDHNTNNIVFGNIMTGGYRFEDKGAGSHCRGGENILMGIGKWQKSTTKINGYKQDITLDGCSYSKGKLTVPRKYAAIMEGLDPFVKKYISVR